MVRLHDRQLVFLERRSVNASTFAIKVKAKEREYAKTLNGTGIWKWLDSNPDVIDDLRKAAPFSACAPRERFAAVAEVPGRGSSGPRADMASGPRANLKVDELQRCLRKIKQLAADLKIQHARRDELMLQRSAEQELRSTVGEGGGG